MPLIKCSIDGCERKANSRGWCKPHYDAWHRQGDPLTYRGDRSHLSDWQKVQEIGWVITEANCWEYRGFRNENGYGQFRSVKENRLLRVHRLAYENLIRPIQPTEFVLHRCDNPPCCNPEHLFTGNQVQNIQDCVAKGRNTRANWTTCPNGHEYPSDRPKNISKNRCRDCANERNRRYYERKRNGLAQQSPTGEVSLQTS